MRTRKRLALILCLCLILPIIQGCAAHRVGTPAGQPVVAITPAETANQDNLQFAIHNRAVAKGLVTARQAGVIEAEYYGTLSAGQIKLTRIHQQLTPLLKDITIPGNAAKVRALLDQVKPIVDSMISTGVVGIKNPQTQATIQLEINAAYTAAEAIWTDLQLAGVVK